MKCRHLHFVFVLLFPTVNGFFKTDIFPYGSAQGDSKLTNEDDFSSSEFQLQTPIIFYEQTHHSVFINTNGLLSFFTDIPNFFNVQFPLEYPIIAPFYADIDTRGSGTIFYRETHSDDLLERATNYVQQHFTGGSSFKAKSALIITWDSVGAYNSKKDKLNTFQLVIASNEQHSYAIILYVDIQWIYSEAKSSNLPEMRAQAGIMAGDGRTTLLPGSGTDQIRNLHKISNVGDKGLWIYQIGYTGPSGNTKAPDLNIGEASISSQVPQGCSVGAAFCHIYANCIDYNPGFCCDCDDGYFGNGKSCLKNDEPQRINGKVSGTLNDHKINSVDLHSYIVTSDGRAYTAISGIEESLGFDMQTLLSAGVVIGWAFALPTGNTLNGYQITGGIFNHTMKIEFPQTGNEITVEQQFQGLDVFNYLRVTVNIQGTIPSIPAERKVEIDDFTEEYTRIAPGMIRSHATHFYHLQDTNIDIPFVVEQTISYDECAYGPIDQDTQTVRLRVSRNYIVYDAREKVIRYAVLTLIEPLSSENPCDVESNQCGAHSSCVVEGDSFRCLCDLGYENLYELVNGVRSTCIDINECSQGKDNCHRDAECINQAGSFSCRCLPGFTGDGVNCLKFASCADLQCSANAECLQLPGRSAECRCNLGFQGDGVNCKQSFIQSTSCLEHEDLCDPNADCLYNPLSNNHECQCLEGYVGNGIVCIEELESCDVFNNCHSAATCLYDEVAETFECVCNENYVGDGYTCHSRDTQIPVSSCNIINNCHPNAHCVYETHNSAYTCRCTAGHEGDGYNCAPSEVTCDSVNICSIYGKCVHDLQENKYVCRCLDGYSGDGIRCNPIDECNSDESCDVNAQCLFDSVARRYICRCNHGYSGDGKECSLDSEVSCNVIDNCHADAQCIYDSYTLNYLCHCRPGFQGDGYTSCVQSVTPCNIHNNCHLNADCTYSTEERGYRCQCQQGFVGDGITCLPSRSCLSDPTQCDSNADCVSHPTLHQHVCQCRHNYQGDGHTCTPIPIHEGDFLLMNHGMATIKIPVKATPDDIARPVALVPYQTAVGIDIDCVEGEFYWADNSGGTIRSAMYNGSDQTIFIDKNIISPEGVAVDWVSRNIFWTDSGKDTIEVARIETKERKVLFNSGLVNPRGIIVHPGRGKIYWTDWDRDAPKIETSNMDGTNREVFVKENLGLPNLLTIDYDREDLCWADAGTQKIECINLYGHNRRTVVAPVTYPFGIANSRDTLYWTDWETKTVQSASKIAYSLNKPISSPLGSHSKVYGIVYVPEVCPRVSNLCAVNNGGCNNLCLANGHGGRTCACPDEGDQEEVAACNEIS